MSEQDLLFNVCSSVCCCHTPAVEPSLCGACLLLKYDSRENVLVQLSAIRCLYSTFSPSKFDLDKAGADFKAFAVEVVGFLSHHSQSFYQLLTGYLESSNQFISFAASKALLFVLLHEGVETHVIEDIFIKLQSHLDTHGAVYCLQTIREFFKVSRKNLKSISKTRDSKYQQLTGECLKIISHNGYWTATLQLYLSISSTDTASTNHGLQQSLAGFLSLTTELLRHNCEEYPLASLVSTAIGNLHQCIASSLLDTLSLVENFSSAFVFKKFIDVVLKVEQVCSVNEVKSVTEALRKLLKFPLVHSILYEWLETHAEKFQLTISSRPNLAKNSISQSERELVDITVRKVILLVLRSFASLLRNISLQQPASDYSGSIISLYHGEPSCILVSLWELLSSCMALDHSRTQQFTKTLYQVVSDEDGCLIRSLQASTSILRLTTQNSAILESVVGLKILVAVVNAHSLWLCFLVRTGFDHSMLLDLVLTPEIDFSSALQDYLTLVTDDWSCFEEVATTTETQELLLGSPMEASEGEHDSAESSDLEDEGTMQEISPSVLKEDPASIPPTLVTALEVERPKPDTTSVTGGLVDYSSSSSEAEEMTEAVSPPPQSHTTTEHFPFKIPQVNPFIPLTSTTPQTSSLPNNETTEPSSSLPPSSSSSPPLPGSGLLGEVMGCLIRLRLSLERLTESELIPHVTASQLISTILTVEELYEK